MNINRPFFSVIITSYNCLDFLKRSIRSVFSQSFDNYELIIVDNCSSDGTAEYISSLRDRLRFFLIQNNGIISISRNKGVIEAKGKWICFLDADDSWDKEKLFEVNRYIKKYPSYECFMHDEYLINENKKIKNLNLLPKGQNLFRSLLINGNCLSTSAVTIKKTTFQELDGFSNEEKYITAEDYELWIRISKKYKVFFIRKVLGNYYVHSKNSSFKNKSLHLKAIMNVLLSNLHDLNNDGKNNIIFCMLIYSNYFQRKGAYLLYRDQILSSLFQSFLSFILNPLNFRTYKNLMLIIFTTLGINKLK